MQLNPQQTKAVTQTEGPVLIVAGAGTGKTRVITQRIARLINEKPGIEPSNILALTFSKKAAQEMLERVEDLISQHRDEIWVSTFHSFAHRVLRDHCLQAGLSSRFTLLDKIEQWIFFRKKLPQMKLEHYLNIADPASCIEGFLRFIAKAKNELVSPAEYAGYISEIDDADEKKRHAEVARVYERYQEFLSEASCMDFADLITETIALFKKRPDILKKYQDQFKYILVDEFQDTNIAQIELICILAGTHKNICVVGDDDQGIYRFRGASYASFIKFKEKFPEAKTLKLEQNYRSTKSILSAAEKLIRNNNPDRYDPDKTLFTQGSQGEDVELLYASDYRQQARGVVDKIKTVYNSLPESKRDYSDFAILYRAHSHKHDVLELLKREGIPHTVTGATGLLDEEEIKDIISFLKTVDDPHDSVSLFQTLIYEGSGLALEELVKLNRFAKTNDLTLFTSLTACEGLTPETKKAITEFKKFLAKAQALAQRQDALNVAYFILEETKYLKRLLANFSPENENKILHISRLCQFINGFVKNHPNKGLSNFLEYLDYYQQAGGDITQQEESSSAGGVRLMTIHQAKGLEFPYVFIISAVSGRFPTRQRPEQIGFPLNLIKERIPTGDFHLQEERRLFYVALTRAKERLFICCVKAPYHRPSIFINEVASEGGDKLPKARSVFLNYADGVQEDLQPLFSKNELAKLDAKRKVLKLFDNMEAVSGTNGAGLEKGLTGLKGIFTDYANNLKTETAPIEAPVEEFKTAVAIPDHLRLSYSQIDTYLSCPLKYKYMYVYSIPTKPSAPLSFGTDVHNVLKEFYTRVKEGESPDYNDLKLMYDNHWSGFGYQDKMQQKKYKNKGLKVLRDYYKINEERIRPPLYIEEEFLIKIDGHSLKGYIDRIDELDDGTVEVIDYKTGKMRGVSFAQKNIQLDIYAIACKEVMGLEPSVLSFYYLEANEKASITPEPQRLQTTKEIILHTISEVKARNFPAKPSRMCKWCDFKGICPEAL